MTVRFGVWILCGIGLKSAKIPAMILLSVLKIRQYQIGVNWKIMKTEIEVREIYDKWQKAFKNEKHELVKKGNEIRMSYLLGKLELLRDVLEFDKDGKNGKKSE